MKPITKTIAHTVLLMLIAATACNDPYNDNPSPVNEYTGGPNPKTPLDTWLYEQFTLPYNIEVKYRQDASETDLFKTLVPAEYNKVQPIMEVSKKIWIDTYTAVAGDAFMKRYTPKQFMLVGSPSYNFNGSVTLGTAEGGRKVVLYAVNHFDKTNRAALVQMAHIIQHEFTHILNQNATYPAEFKAISAGKYTANWTTVSQADAREMGFITSYAMDNPDEDVAEMTSMMMVMGKDAFERMLSCETSADGNTALRKKEQLIVEYFRKAFDIDFYSLQTKVQAVIESLSPSGGGGGTTPPDPLLSVWGFDKANTTFNIDLLTMPTSQTLVSAYDSDNALLHNENLALDANFKLAFVDTDQVLLTLYFHTINAPDRDYYEANVLFGADGTANDGTIEFTYLGADANGRYLLNSLGAVELVSYFDGKTFHADWFETCSGTQYPALLPVDAPANYCLGQLSE